MFNQADFQVIELANLLHNKKIQIYFQMYIFVEPFQNVYTWLLIEKQ